MHQRVCTKRSLLSVSLVLVAPRRVLLCRRKLRLHLGQLRRAVRQGLADLRFSSLRRTLRACQPVKLLLLLFE